MSTRRRDLERELRDATERRDEVIFEQMRNRQFRNMPLDTLFVELLAMVHRHVQHASGTANAVLRIVKALRREFREMFGDGQNHQQTASNAVTSALRRKQSARSLFADTYTSARPLEHQLALYENRQPFEPANSNNRNMALYGPIASLPPTVALGGLLDMSFENNADPLNNERAFRDICKLLILLYEDCELVDADLPVGPLDAREQSLVLNSQLQGYPK